MASSSKNVKIGVCDAFYGGLNLGLTKGGVEVKVETATHEVTVDQYGSTPIGELITGRTVSVTVPMAETTLENMVAVTPGATLITDGVKASGKVTVASQAAVGNSVTVAGLTFTFIAANAATAKAGEVRLGGDIPGTAKNLAAAIATSEAPYDATAAAGVVTLTARATGPEYNGAITVAATSANLTKTDITGGVAATTARVDVPTGVGLNLLDFAKTLRLRPRNTTGDYDFVIGRAATPGALNFAYQLENERIFNVEFKGYVDVESGGALFSIGNNV